jgi:hypothetical protein
MAINDVPAFFSNFSNVEEGENPDREFLGNLEAEDSHAKPAPTQDVQIEDEPQKDSAQDTPAPETPAIDPTKVEDQAKGGENNQAIQTPPTKVDGKNSVTPPTPSQKIFGKYDTMDQAEAAFRALEQSTQKVQDQIANPDEEFKAQIAGLLSSPLVKINVPDYKEYMLTNGDFDMKNYLNDTLQGFVMELQKEMLNGKLGAAQFGMLSRTLRQQNDEILGKTRQDQEADNMWTKLTTSFPILTQERQQKLYTDILIGMKSREKREGKERNWAYEDYEAVAVSLLGDDKNITPTAPQQDPVERISGAPTINAGTPAPQTEEDEIFRDIENMSRVKSRGQLF